jgi:hypothetical protein
LYRSQRHTIFVFFPSTRTYIHPVDAGIQHILPSAMTLISRPTTEPVRQFTASLLPSLYCMIRLDVFSSFHVPTYVRQPVDVGIQSSACICSDTAFRSTRNQPFNCNQSITILLTCRTFSCEICNYSSQLYIFFLSSDEASDSPSRWVHIHHGI